MFKSLLRLAKKLTQKYVWLARWIYWILVLNPKIYIFPIYSMALNRNAYYNIHNDIHVLYMFPRQLNSTHQMQSYWCHSSPTLHLSCIYVLFLHTRNENVFCMSFNLILFLIMVIIQRSTGFLFCNLFFDVAVQSISSVAQDDDLMTILL